MKPSMRSAPSLLAAHHAVAQGEARSDQPGQAAPVLEVTDDEGDPDQDGEHGGGLEEHPAVVAQHERLEDSQHAGQEGGGPADRAAQDQEDQPDRQRTAERAHPPQPEDEIHAVAGDPEEVDRDRLDDEEAGRVQEERPVRQVGQFAASDGRAELRVEHLVDPQLEAGGQPDGPEAERGQHQHQRGHDDGPDA
jgi:hypothetical protein